MTTTTFQPPPVDRLPVAMNHWGNPLEMLSYAGLLIEGQHLLAGLQKYAWHRQRPGHFLCALLANDLAQCICRADPLSLLLLKELIWYVQNEMPEALHGNMAAVDAWAPEKTA